VGEVVVVEIIIQLVIQVLLVEVLALLCLVAMVGFFLIHIKLFQVAPLSLEVLEVLVHLLVLITPIQLTEVVEDIMEVGEDMDLEIMVEAEVVVVVVAIMEEVVVEEEEIILEEVITEMVA
jgi:hypothetical protein